VLGFADGSVEDVGTGGEVEPITGAVCEEGAGGVSAGLQAISPEQAKSSETTATHREPALPDWIPWPRITRPLLTENGLRQQS
jgi:hypothetical protein